MKLHLLLAAVLLSVFGFFGTRSAWLSENLSDNLASFFANPGDQQDLILFPFPINSQQYSNSCGPATISMVVSFLEAPVSERDFSRRVGYQEGKSGMLPGQFSHYLQLGLKNYHVALVKNLKDTAVLEDIYRQLQRGIPVPIYFSTINAWDQPN